MQTIKKIPPCHIWDAHAQTFSYFYTPSTSSAVYSITLSQQLKVCLRDMPRGIFWMSRHLLRRGREFCMRNFWNLIFHAYLTRKLMNEWINCSSMSGNFFLIEWNFFKQARNAFFYDQRGFLKNYQINSDF